MIIDRYNKESHMAISAITISKNKKRLSLNHCKVIESIGIEGDEKGGKPFREISIYLIPKDESIDLKNGLCFKKFKANLDISGYEGQKIKVNTLLKIGSSLLKVNSVGKSCYEDCDLVKNKCQCSLKTNVLFSSIIEEGTISINDSVSIIK